MDDASGRPSAGGTRAGRALSKKPSRGSLRAMAGGLARSPGVGGPYRTELAPVPEMDVVSAPEFDIMAQEANTSAMLHYTASLPKRGNAVASLLQDLRTVLQAQEALLNSSKVSHATRTLSWILPYCSRLSLPL